MAVVVHAFIFLNLCNTKPAMITYRLTIMTSLTEKKAS